MADRFTDSKLAGQGPHDLAQFRKFGHVGRFILLHEQDIMKRKVTGKPLDDKRSDLYAWRRFLSEHYPCQYPLALGCEQFNDGVGDSSFAQSSENAAVPFTPPASDTLRNCSSR